MPPKLIASIGGILPNFIYFFNQLFVIFTKVKLIRTVKRTESADFVVKRDMKIDHAATFRLFRKHGGKIFLPADACCILFFEIARCVVMTFIALGKHHFSLLNEKFTSG